MAYDPEKRRFLLQQLWKMKPGDGFNIDPFTFGDCFRGNIFTGRPAIDELLEALPGSNWGTYRAERRGDGVVVVTRHEEGRVRVREDWDRR